MRLQCAMLFVKDFARMKEFYGRMLGADPINHAADRAPGESWAAFETGGVRFALHAIPAELASAIEISSPPAAREMNPVKLIFAVDDVAAERARLEALGVTMLPRAWQDPEGSCDGLDPEGNVFQIARMDSF